MRSRPAIPLRHLRYPGVSYFDGDLFDGAPDDGDEDLMRHDPPWTKQDHPYCYDPFTIWGDPRPSKECNGTVYVDRLEQWDASKYRRLAREHYRSGDTCFERPFDSYNCKGHLIERFLRDWFDDPKLRLLRVIEYCNPNTGYPTWSMSYVSPKEASARTP